MDTNAEDFRVMIVDDITESGNLNAEELRESLGSAVRCTVVSTLQDAKEHLATHCVDFVATDYNLGRAEPSGGLRVLEHLRAVDAKVDAAVYTRFYSDSSFTDAALQTMTLLANTKVTVHAAVNIGDGTEPLVEAVRNAHKTWIERRVDLEDELGLGAVLQRSKIGSWISANEAYAEALRVVSEIYGNAGLGADPMRFRVRIPGDNAYDVTEGFSDRGNSGAIVVYPEINLDFEAGGPLKAVRTVLKLGAPPDLQSERDKFRNVVAFGVPLRGRVEFLGYSRRQNLAGLCYGFAGGVFGDQVISMRRDLHHPGGVARAQSAVRDLFSKDSKSWYRQEFRERVSQSSYVRRSNRRPLDDLFGRFLARLLDLPTGREELVRKRTRQDHGGVIRATIGTAKLEFPTREVAGSELMRAPCQQTLVHGDMHTGNVLVEILTRNEAMHKQRTVMIDFANAGRGPRAEDLATLYASVAHGLASSPSLAAQESPSTWLSAQYKQDRLRLTSAFGLADPALRVSATSSVINETLANGYSLNDPTQSDTLLNDILIALAVNFDDLTFGELAASLMVRSMELSIHETDQRVFLRLAGLAATVHMLLGSTAS